jgi:hypothetical protein
MTCSPPGPRKRSGSGETPWDSAANMWPSFPRHCPNCLAEITSVEHQRYEIDITYSAMINDEFGGEISKALPV